MEWYQNYQITPSVQSALKRSNQRIVQTIKTFGKSSSIYKQNIGKFQKGPYSKYLSTSKSGNLKFDVRTINKLIRSGNVPRSEINQFLSEAAGIKIDPEGNVVKIENGGIPTVSEIEKKTRKKISSWGESEDMYNKQEVRDIAEQLAEFSENFQTTYEAYIANFGEASAREDSVVRELYGDYRAHRLTYRQLQQIKNKMEADLKEAKEESLQFERDNTEEL